MKVTTYRLRDTAYSECSTGIEAASIMQTKHLPEFTLKGKKIIEWDLFYILPRNEKETQLLEDLTDGNLDIVATMNWGEVSGKYNGIVKIHNKVIEALPRVKKEVEERGHMMDRLWDLGRPKLEGKDEEGKTVFVAKSVHMSCLNCMHSASIAVNSEGELKTSGMVIANDCDKNYQARVQKAKEKGEESPQDEVATIHLTKRMRVKYLRHHERKLREAGEDIRIISAVGIAAEYMSGNFGRWGVPPEDQAAIVPDNMGNSQ